MKTKNICPSCKIVLGFDRTLLSTVKCPQCGYQGKVANYKELVENTVEKTEVGGKNKIYKPGKLEFLESDVQWLQKERVVILQRGINTLGRMSPHSTSNLQLAITDPYMSKTHATIDIIMKQDGIFDHRLSDKGSKNGTFHNGDRLDEGDVIKLMPGDIIRLGHTCFKFIVD